MKKSILANAIISAIKNEIDFQMELKNNGEKLVYSLKCEFTPANNQLGFNCFLNILCYDLAKEERVHSATIKIHHCVHTRNKSKINYNDVKKLIILNLVNYKSFELFDY